MKTKLFTVIFLAFVIVLQVQAQDSKKASITIQTSAQCEMCKERIEKALAFEKGVINSNLDLDTKIVTVSYKSNRTSPENIRKAITAVGYDADEVKADVQAYESLPGCCKKPDDPNHIPH
jgi:mercuric ion binding protein